MENENKKGLNVPPLRFPEFKGEWTKITASSFLKTFSTNSLTWEQLNYSSGQIKDIHYGLIHSQFTQTLVNSSKVNIPFVNSEIQIRNYTSIKPGDLILADASEDTNEIGQPIELTDISKNETIIAGLHTIHCRDIKELTVKGFKAFLFKSKSVKHRLYSLAEGTKIYSISPSTLDEIDLFIPKAAEQTKIVSLLSTLEKKIDIQRKTIEDLEKERFSLLKSIYSSVFRNASKKLVQIVNIETGKLNASASNAFGKYKFFTCSKKDSLTNSFSFDNEAIIIPGNGDIGIVKYYKGKFDAYQRTYVCILKDRSFDLKYIKLILEVCLPYIVSRMKNRSAMTYIVLSTLENIPIPLLEIKKQKDLNNIMELIDKRIEVQEGILDKLLKLKKYLLRTLFI